MSTPTSNKLSGKKLRICHVITRMIIGGAQENTLLTVRGLLERGHDVVLLTGPTRGPEGKLLEEARTPGLRIVEEPFLCRDLSPFRDIQAFRRMSKFFKKNHFDVVHTHSSKAGILGRLAARHADCPMVVHTVHGQAFHDYEKWWRNKLYIAAEKIAAKRSDHIFSVAQAMIEQCVAADIAPREKYSVVYSGMDLAPYLEARSDPELRRQLGIPPDAPVVGKIARLFELKGHEYLLEAASEIVRQVPNVRFLLVGDGILRDALAASVQSKGLRDNFVFTGLVPPHEIPRYVGIMDVLVHLSLREGLPRTIVQALAGGVPAVGYSLDGTPEIIINGQTGFLCPPCSVSEVQSAVLKLLKNPQQARRLGEAGRELVKAKFDWRQMVEQLEAAYLRQDDLRSKN